MSALKQRFLHKVLEHTRRVTQLITPTQNKCSIHELKNKSQLANIDVDVTLEVAKLFNFSCITFYRQARQLLYRKNGVGAEERLYITQLAEDKFKVSHYYGSFGKHGLNTDHIFTKEEVLMTLPMLKYKKITVG